MMSMKALVKGIAERCPGRRLPDSYLVFDLETSGFNHSPPPGKKIDVITQFGVAAIKDRQMVENLAILVKRPPGTMTEGATRVTGITDEILMEKGTEPAEVFPKMIKLLEVYRAAQCMFIGHNAVGFDIPFLAADCERHDQDFRIMPNECIDTGMIFKAAQLRLTPGPSEDLHRFFCRIKDIRSHAKWNLPLAAQMLNVDRNNGLDLSKAHDAGFDCLVTHLVFEAMRELSER